MQLFPFCVHSDLFNIRPLGPSAANPTCAVRTVRKVLTRVPLEISVEDDAREETTDQFEKDASRHFEGFPTFLIWPLKTRRQLKNSNMIEIDNFEV